MSGKKGKLIENDQRFNTIPDSLYFHFPSFKLCTNPPFKHIKPPSLYYKRRATTGKFYLSIVQYWLLVMGDGALPTNPPTKCI